MLRGWTIVSHSYSLPIIYFYISAQENFPVPRVGAYGPIRLMTWTLRDHVTFCIWAEAFHVITVVSAWFYSNSQSRDQHWPHGSYSNSLSLRTRRHMDPSQAEVSVYLSKPLRFFVVVVISTKINTEILYKFKHYKESCKLEFLLWLRGLRIQCCLCEDVGLIPGLSHRPQVQLWFNPWPRKFHMVQVQLLQQINKIK